MRTYKERSESTIAFVLKTITEYGEERYIHTKNCAVCCPELAAKYDDRKCALTMKRKLLKEHHYTNIEVVDYSYDIIIKAHKLYQDKGEDVVNNTIRKSRNNQSHH
ncbi:MAG: hypothetical protein E7490_05285 [Ruminococcaceae bacterium]|nr:hypothetical protein [Oscillospiraceae bacterium]